MATTLTVRDETPAGELLGETVLEFLTEKITVRELIRSRVYQEVQDYNAKPPERFRGLVEPTATETISSGPQSSPPRQVNWTMQFEAAVDAFKHHRIVILIDDREATDLDEQIVISPQTQVAFLKLVPLIGG